MSALDLKLEDDPAEAFVTEKTFNVLRDYLQPDTSLTLEQTAQAILDVLPDKEPLSSDIDLFGEVFIELSELVPYNHPSQLKLAALLERIGLSTKLGQAVNDMGRQSGTYCRFRCLAPSVRDNYMSPDPEDPSRYVNFQTFVAHLDERRIFRTDPTWAIWAQREAHETRQEDRIVHASYVSGAAQWILVLGQSLFHQLQFPGGVTRDDLRAWNPGPLYQGKAALNLDRWHFWRDAFKAVASGKGVGGKGYDKECRTLAAKAAELMDTLEKCLKF